MKMKRLTLTLLLLVAIAINALASDFIEVDGLKLYINTDSNTAKVIENNYSGDITIPATVIFDNKEYPITTIGEEAFASCNINTISFGKNITTLEDGCFKKSTIRRFTFQSQFTKVGNGCFEDCYYLSKVTIENGVSIIPEACFKNCTNLKFDNLPMSLTEIGNTAFYGCSVVDVKIPSSVTKLGIACFMACKNLKHIELTNSIHVIPVSFVRKCSSLEDFIIPNSVDSVMGSAFSGTSIHKISFPSSTKIVGQGIVDDCKYLIEIRCLSQDPPKIGGSMSMYPMFKDFKNIDNCKLYVPKESIEVYKKDKQWGVFTRIKEIEGDVPSETQSCSTPTISYKDGKLRFECNTTGAEYHYTISDSNVATDKYNENGEVQLDGKLDISVYATADGYRASDRANATIYWLDGEETTDNINLAKNKRGVMVSTNNGITISGLSDGEVITIYSVDGKNLGSAKAIQGTAHFNTPIQSLVILKINGKEIKISTL